MNGPKTIDTIQKEDWQWRDCLSQWQYQVARLGVTEPPFTGEYYDCQETGIYSCVCCGLPLFDSKDKFRSGCGWPCFSRPLAELHLRQLEDKSLGMKRTEVRCARCDAHLGHLFHDGPLPSRLRYCINSTSLKLLPPEE